jgi:hypothetical protein
MNKFFYSDYPVTDETKPVLFKVFFGNKYYYLHKGKKLKESTDRFLDDIYRGMRGKICPEYYSEVVKYCNKHPQVYKVTIEVVLNDEPDKILRKETALYKSMRKDPEALNRLDIEPYKPEWMLRDSYQKRCENCIKSGVIGSKKISFKFCPNCGRINK